MENELAIWPLYQISTFCLSLPAFENWMQEFLALGVEVKRVDLNIQGAAFIVGKVFWVAVPGFSKYCAVFLPPEIFAAT